ncbi:MAG: hypothetical protein M1282_08730 [Chloroflexi bacterium]|nr:hypothetical protein [Chloroflexota bacterium]
MKTNTPTLNQWKELYGLAAEIKAMEPWTYMEESHIFGFQLPGSDQLGFVSVMGMLGEHFAVSVYKGAKGLSGFWTAYNNPARAAPETILQTPQVMLSWEDRDMITAEDRAVINHLGLKFRGSKAWPQFREYQPGCFPWYLESSDAELLICGLEQLLQMAPPFEKDRKFFSPIKYPHDYLIRVNRNGKWEDEVRRVEFREEKTLEFQMDNEALEHLRGLMPGKTTIEIDLNMMLNPVQEKSKERPYYPFMLLFVDKESHMILGAELLEPLPSMNSMYEEVPAVVVESLAAGFPPKEIHVKDAMLYVLLQPVAEELGFKLKKMPRLPALERVKRELDDMMGGLRI